MTGAKKKDFPIIRLHYKKGELIMKEGDYGISIYKVIKGHVRVFKDHGDMEITLATLGPGEVFGEMAFLNKMVETRSASVRAVDSVELEVWHPSRLTKEYEQMSPILKYIVNQTLNRYYIVFYPTHISCVSSRCRGEFNVKFISPRTLEINRFSVGIGYRNIGCKIVLCYRVL